MIARHEVLLSLYGAWRLFLRDPRGIEWLDDSVEGYWKSFFCAVVVLPAFVIWISMRNSGLEGVGFIRIVTVEGIEYVIQWVSWPLIMAYIAPAIGRDDKYISYIVAFNWSAGVYVCIYLIVIGIKLTGIVSGGGLALIGLVAVIAILTYHWYVARVALEVSGGVAAALVAGEFLLAHMIDAVGQNLLR